MSSVLVNLYFPILYLASLLSYVSNLLGSPFFFTIQRKCLSSHVLYSSKFMPFPQDSRVVLSSRNMMQATYMILNFLIAILKRYNGTGAVNFHNIFFIFPYRPKIVSFQHVIKIKIIEIFDILFFSC